MKIYYSPESCKVFLQTKTFGIINMRLWKKTDILNFIYNSLIFDNKLSYDKGNIEYEEDKQEPSIKKDRSIVRIISDKYRQKFSERNSFNRLSSIQEAPSLDEASQFRKSKISSSLQRNPRQYRKKLTSGLRFPFNMSGLTNN